MNSDHVGAVAACRRDRGRGDGVFETAPPRWRQRDVMPPRRRRRAPQAIRTESSDRDAPRRWIRQMEAPNKLNVLKMSGEYMRNMESAIQFGFPVLTQREK